MDLSKKILLYIVYGLIKLGDIVLIIINIPKKALIRVATIVAKVIVSNIKSISFVPDIAYTQQNTVKLKERKKINFINLLSSLFLKKNSTKEIVLFEEKIKNTQALVYHRNKKNILQRLIQGKRKVGRPHKKIKINSVLGAVLNRVKFFIFGVLFSFIFLFLPLLIFVFASDLPNPYYLSVNTLPKTTKIYDRSGILLYEIYANQNRTIVKLQDIPKILQLATVAVEDKDFYNHPGFDFRGIVRAAVSNLRENELQGGSTITQQLIKSAYLTPAPTIQRKLKEIVLAFWAERVYTKQEILELYFNYVPYGGTAWGVQSASQVYFDKNVKDITLPQAAFLAGMPKAPSIYSPFSKNPEAWKKRQKEVLDAMVRNGYITQVESNKAYKEDLKFRSPKVPIKAPHFVMYIKDLLVEKYGLSEVERGGLKVTTTLDLSLQEKAQTLVAEEVEKNSYLNITNGAALVTNPTSGEILAMVGGKDYFDRQGDGNVNITTSYRQPGSTIKIVTYTLALASGRFTDATILDDAPLSVPLSDGKVYSPVNYDGKFHGKLPLRLALANSLNIPAVRVARDLGVESIVNFGKQMGISSWNNSAEQYGLSITLGGAEVTMLDLSTVFGTIANKGERVNVDPFIKVEDSDGKILYELDISKEQVVSEGVAYIISDILADNNARSMEFGSNSPLNIPNHKVSVKTGTSDNKRDNWTVGFGNNFLVATWVGNNDNTPMSQNLASGITGAAPMWNRIITMLLEGKQDLPQRVPDNVVKKSCLGRDFFFIRGTESSVKCTVTPSVTGIQPTATPLPTITPTPSQPQNNFLYDFLNRRNERKKKDR